MSDFLGKQLELTLEQSREVELPVRNALYQHLDERRPVVLFGAGNLGRQLTRVLLEAGVNVACLCDNQKSLWSSEIGSCPVLKPADAVSRYGSSAFFIIAVWHPCRASDVLATTSQLRELGALQIAPFSLLLDRFSELLPRMFWSTSNQINAHANEIRTLWESLADDLSRRSLLNALRLRLFHDFGAANFVAPGRQYFPPDLYRISDDEVFIDCGAFDGDSIADFIEESNGVFRKIIAFEADPGNFAKLRSTTANSELGHLIDTRQCAVGITDGVARFSGGGLDGSAVCDTGAMTVPSVRLDTALRGESPTIIKMDIEGAESEALDGLGTSLPRDLVLAVCVYHRPEDLWKLPSQMHTLMPESLLFMRSHCADGFDLVAYSVPVNRLKTRNWL